MTARRRNTLLLTCLATLTLVRLVVAGIAPLAPDEAYYWVFSRALAPSYLDHPPMMALWIRAGTAIAGQGALGVRLLGPLSAALGSFMLYDAAEHMFPARNAGAVAAALWNGTLLAGVGAVIMTPDTPLLFFWTACLWALARLLDGGRPAWWLAIGLFSGLALASKYTALLLWVGIALWLLWVPAMRRWWRSPMLWTGALLGGAVFLPVVAWNAQHHWASFLRQGGRLEAWQPSRAAQFLAELVGSQCGLLTPLVFLFFVGGVVWAACRAWQDRDPAWTMLAALTLPAAAVFLQHALGGRVEGNWPAVICPAATVGGAALSGMFWQRLRSPAVALGLAITALVYAQAATFALPLPPRLDPIAHQLAGWDSLATAVDAARRERGGDCVASEAYGIAAELARALPAGVDVLAVGPRWPLFRLPPPRGAIAACILVSPASGAPAGWRDVQAIGSVQRVSHGDTIQRVTLWRVGGLAPSLPAAVLPRYTGR